MPGARKVHLASYHWKTAGRPRHRDEHLNRAQFMFNNATLGARNWQPVERPLQDRGFIYFHSYVLEDDHAHKLTVFRRLKRALSLLPIRSIG